MQFQDAWQKFSWKDLARMADAPRARDGYDPEEYNEDETLEWYATKLPDRTGADNVAGGGGAANPGRVDMRIHRAIYQDMGNPKFLSHYDNDAGVNLSGDSPWRVLMGMANGGANQLRPPLGAPAYVALTIDGVLGYWGLEQADTTDTVQAAYAQLCSDIRDFIFGNNVRMMKAEKRELFQRLNFYARMGNILAALYANTPDLNDPTVPAGAPPATYAANFGDNRKNPLDPPVADMITQIVSDRFELVVIRPNIEHEMLGIVMGRGGVDELGATLWGQTELSVYDDSMYDPTTP
jgi:hypothetical protein